MLLPNGEICIYKQDGASDYFVNNPYEPDSDYSFMLKGSRARMEGLSGYFEEKGITFPEMTDWKFHGLESKGVLEPDKRRRADDDNGLEPSAASSGSPPNKAPRVATVAAALRHRLAKTEPAGGTPVKTEEAAREEVTPPSRRRISGNK